MPHMGMLPGPGTPQALPMALLQLAVLEVELGRVVLERDLEADELRQVGEILQEQGFELVLPNQPKVTEQIKRLIHEVIYQQEGPKNIKFSEYLARNIGRDYSFLSHTFSRLDKMTIEKYIILQKIIYAKKLLADPELSLSQVASRLSFSSVSHLSLQFKRITGYTPSKFRTLLKTKKS
jgi:AraC family transcriptional regulator